MSVWEQLSIIVPVSETEDSWLLLAQDLATLPKETEVILVGIKNSPGHRLFEEFRTRSPKRASRFRWIESSKGRARQQNAGVTNSERAYLWFLHADTRLSARAREALEFALNRAPNVLHYFELAFNSDGPRFMFLNQAGANFRSRVLGIPFGDQGFCMARQTFERIGGFDESVPYGEDHLLVWRARQMGIPIECTGASLSTSARKYRDRGWLKTTINHLSCTLRQALPEAVTLLKRRVKHDRL